MDRREFLGACAACVAGGVAGCVRAPGADLRASSRPTSVGDVELPVSRDELFPAIGSVIPAIVDPAFADDWSGVEAARPDRPPRLLDEDPVVGIARGDEARAYPLSVLQWHEIVNDRLGGPLLVTYCTMCGSSVVAKRLVRGEPAVFEVSHMLWKANLVMRDRATGSLWSQLLATAINGPATGDRLELLPSTLTTWADWRSTYPDAKVLLPPPHSGTISGTSGQSYDDVWDVVDDAEGIIGEDADGDDLPDKALVIGVRAGDEAKAYPFGAVNREGVVNDAVGDRPVVVAVGPGRTLVAYDRRVDGEVLTFAPDGDAFMRAGGSRWLRFSGVAVDGPYGGTRLSRATDLPPLFWFAWEDFSPGTTVYTGAG